jgi:hypothetical protein
MADKTYRVALFTVETWQEFLDAGANVTGFRERRWNTIQQMSVGDVLLCYLTGVSRFITALEMVSQPFKESIPIWKHDVFPCRVCVEVLVRLTPETAIPVIQLKDYISIFENFGTSSGWSIYFRSSPTRWKYEDGEAVVSALIDAKNNPIVRPLRPAKRTKQY